jgi:hypothetical protein
MDEGLSMQSRAEITVKYAKGYVRASKRDRGRMLDEVVAVTGWSRDNARRRLVAGAKAGPASGGNRAVAGPRKPRARKYSYDAVKVLQRVWAASGGQCGKHLAASMQVQLDGLERHGELVLGVDRYDAAVRAELLGMSGASIDRYLAPARARDAIKGRSTTKASPLLRSAIQVRKAGDEVEAEPGFLEGDTVAHCGPTLKGEFARTLNLTCLHTGWTFTRSMRNNAHVHVLKALDLGVEAIPFEVVGVDFDNGSEFLNGPVIGWAADRSIFFTRSRPYRKNDQAPVESKNNHLVRKHAFHYRHDSPEELRVLNRLWPLVNDRMNFLTPTKKPIDWGTDRNGRRKRIYESPATPFDRLLASDVLSRAQQVELTAYRDRLNPAELARRIHELQQRLILLAKDKTEQIYLSTFPTALPDVRKGIRVKAG